MHAQAVCEGPMPSRNPAEPASASAPPRKRDCASPDEAQSIQQQVEHAPRLLAPRGLTRREGDPAQAQASAANIT